jgi:N6-L-threonylcarbamoyladenine synthase
LDVAASFQAACVEILIEKIKRAARRIGARSILAGGGVSANHALREALAKLSLPTFLPKLQYCVDNAAMSAGLALTAYSEDQFSDLGLDAITFSRFRR